MTDTGRPDVSVGLSEDAVAGGFSMICWIDRSEVDPIGSLRAVTYGELSWASQGDPDPKVYLRVQRPYSIFGIARE